MIPIEPTGLVPASQNELRSARRLLRRKDRSETGLFLAEGPQVVREALRPPGRVRTLFVVAEALDRHPELVGSAVEDGVAVRLVSDRDLGSLSDAVTPQGVVAVCDQVDVPLAVALGSAPRLVVCCAQVRDPGNAGTVIRCADAFGADAVVLSAGSVDAYNPKTVRAGVGSLFHLPVSLGAALPEIVEAAHAAGLEVLAADGSGEADLAELAASGELAGPTMWLLGNEAWGLPDEHAALADRVVRVPLYGAAESLNLSTAAAVCLYASATAQRAGATGR
ncbi:MAG: putative rRNA methyltransferase tsnR [Friedmanniella sp.]|nr:putative rRNA methyltransferase tsnR [Friedmanniella sp.]